MPTVGTDSAGSAVAVSPVLARVRRLSLAGAASAATGSEDSVDSGSGRGIRALAAT